MTTMESVRNLIARKETIEKELTDSRKYLDDLGVGMTAALVDSEGYPRSDIDLYAVRTARQRVNCLLNDLRDTMKEIEEQLHLLHGQGGTEESDAKHENGHGSMMVDKDMEAGNAEQPAPHRTSNIPFLMVSDVANGSPASTAGLVNGDLVIQFGSLCHSNFGQLQQVAEIVQNSAGRAIRLTVLRDNHAVRLSLTPKRWSGQGLLGCRVSGLPSER